MLPSQNIQVHKSLYIQSYQPETKKKKLHDDITYTNMRSNFARRPYTTISIQLSMNRDLIGE